MERKEYRTRDKSGWGDGPWQSEPDKIQWRDEATGLACLIVRNNGGSLCGYVGVPDGHAWHGKGYDDVNAEVHGGATFAGPCSKGTDESHGICHVAGPGEPDHVWWIGFDCSHAGDYDPASNARLPEHLRDHIGDPCWGNETIQYRDVAFVTAEVASLARQAAAGKEPSHVS